MRALAGACVVGALSSTIFDQLEEHPGCWPCCSNRKIAIADSRPTTRAHGLAEADLYGRAGQMAACRSEGRPWAVSLLAHPRQQAQRSTPGHLGSRSGARMNCGNAQAPVAPGPGVNFLHCCMQRIDTELGPRQGQQDQALVYRHL